MNEKLAPEKVQEIFEANACCKSGSREKNSKEFARINADLGIADNKNQIYFNYLLEGQYYWARDMLEKVV